MILKFRMVCDESATFVRDYEVDASMTLLDLNDFICEELGYDTDGMTSFFLADERWRKLKEFTVMDMGGGMGPEEEAPVAMSDVKLHQIIRTMDDRLIWVFDIFADRAYFLELVEPKQAEEGVVYPRVQFAHGEPVDQYDADAENGGEKSIFEEMMDDFGDFGGDDSYDDEY